MLQQVIKRDGSQVKFNGERIRQAVLKAARAANEQLPEGFEHEVEAAVHQDSTFTCASIEFIQDRVEHILMKSPYEDTAKAYVTYRKQRAADRKYYEKNVKTFNEIIDVADTNVKNENANINGNTPAGQMMKFASETTKQYAMTHLLNPEHARAHEEGLIHIHDLDYMPTKTTTCVQYDLNSLFKDGFDSGHGYLREPQSIRSAGALAAIAFQANQNEQHGGQAIPAFDHFMAPSVHRSFIKYFMKYAVMFELAFDWANNDEAYVERSFEAFDEPQDCRIYIGNADLQKHEYKKVYEYALRDTTEETEQAMEAFLANMNSMHSRGGGQVVFSSINYGSDTSPEGRMVTFALLKALEEGLGRGETPIFPIHIFKVKDGLSYSEEDFELAINNMDQALAGELDYKTPNFDLFVRSCVVSSKRLFPNFVFLDAPFNRHEKWDINDPERFKYEIATMGCRTRVFEDLHGEKTSWSRGNLSFTTINLVRLAIEARQMAEEHSVDADEEKVQEWTHEYFLNMLNDTCELVAEQLYDRYKFQCTAKAKQYPFLMGQGLWTGGEELAPSDRVEEVLKHGSLCIGYIGLAEALKAMFGKHHGESEDSQVKGLGIVSMIQLKCLEYRKKYDLNYSCLATPAEGLAGRFTGIDRKKYGSITGVTDREYYTNSNHVPVYYPITAHEKIMIEQPYHALTPGGHILYVEMDAEAKKNTVAFMQLIRTMHLNGVGYGSVNHPVDRCTVCGHEGSIEDACPDCGETERIDRIRRITGYLVGTTDRWNSYKKAEERDRVKHGLS